MALILASGPSLGWMNVDRECKTSEQLISRRAVLQSKVLAATGDINHNLSNSVSSSLALSASLIPPPLIDLIKTYLGEYSLIDVVKFNGSTEQLDSVSFRSSISSTNLMSAIKERELQNSTKIPMREFIEFISQNLKTNPIEAGNLVNNFFLNASIRAQGHFFEILQSINEKDADVILDFVLANWPRDQTKLGLMNCHSKLFNKIVGGLPCLREVHLIQGSSGKSPEKRDGRLASPTEHFRAIQLSNVERMYYEFPFARNNTHIKIFEHFMECLQKLNKLYIDDDLVFITGASSVEDLLDCVNGRPTLQTIYFDASMVSENDKKVFQNALQGKTQIIERFRMENSCMSLGFDQHPISIAHADEFNLLYNQVGSSTNSSIPTEKLEYDSARQLCMRFKKEFICMAVFVVIVVACVLAVKSQR